VYQLRHRAGRVRLAERGAGLDRAGLDLGGRDPDGAARRLRVGRRFLDTMLVVSVRELVSVFGWSPAGAHAALDELVDRGEAVLEAGAYRPGA
jgi:hypothetical protein